LPERERVKVIFRLWQYSKRWASMNSTPLSESMPTMGKGNRLVASSIASTTQTVTLFLTERFSVQPVATSVMVRVKQNSPLELALVAHQVDLEKARAVLGLLGPGADG
jgi:hypothetical protein